MSKAIDNLVEMIESGDSLMKFLDKRANRLETYKGYGPPDLCYLVKESTGTLFAKPSVTGYFHYVYGLDTSSFTSVISYIWSVVKQSKFKYFPSHASMLVTKSSTKITKAVFCIYDIIFHRDVRVEVCFPGSMTVYSADGVKKDSVSELEWSCAFVSSVVRAFHPCSGNGVCVFPPLESKELYESFLKAAVTVIKKGTST